MTVCAARLTDATLATLTLGYLYIRSLGNSSTFHWVIPWPELAGVLLGVLAARHGRHRPFSEGPFAVLRTSLNAVELGDGDGGDTIA